MRIAAPILAFVLTVLAGDRIVSAVAAAILRRSQNSFVLMYEGKSAADLLLLGDSRMDRNVDTAKLSEITGKRCLNLGLGGNSVAISEALLHDYVERYGSPGIVVLELGHTTVEPGTMGEMRIFSYRSANIRRLAQQADPIYSMAEGLFRSLMFNDPSFFRLAIEAVQPPGSRLLYNRIPAASVESLKKAPPLTRRIHQDNLAALQRIVAFCSRRGIRVECFIGPSLVDFRGKVENYDEWRRALIEAVRPVKLYDYSDSFDGIRDEFNDELHLNAQGAARLAARMQSDMGL